MDMIEGELSTIHMLYADGNEELLVLTKRFLESASDGIEIETASLSRRAWRLLEPGSFDTAVSDYRMPGTSGFELLLELRDGRDSGIPFATFTGRSHGGVTIEVLNPGTDGYPRRGGDLVARYGVLR